MTEYRVRQGAGGEGGTLPSLAAAATVAKRGDTVIVEPGVYRERLAADTPGVTWQAAGPGAVIDGRWDGKAHNASIFQSTVTVDGATVEGFTIRDCPGRAMVITGDGAVVRDCAIDNCYASGIGIQQAKGARLERVSVERTGMKWKVANDHGSVAALAFIECTDCIADGCTFGRGYGEGIDIGRGSVGCAVRNCIVHDHGHVQLYFVRSSDCEATGNVVYLSGDTNWRIGDNWPSGICIGDESGPQVAKFAHSRGNIVRGNVVVNCGTLFDVRNNVNSYDTQLLDTIVERNTFVAGPCTRVAVHLRENQHGRPHRNAQFRGNVVEFGNAPEGAEIGRFTGGEVTFERNAWTRQPPANMRGAGDVAGPLGLVEPGAAIGAGFDLDHYRPRAGGPLDGAGIGALAVEGPEPPPDPEPDPDPEPGAVDWGTLIGWVEATRDGAVTVATSLDALLVDMRKYRDAA